MNFVSNTISVIIPIHNREKFVEECVASVLAQTYPHLEVILIDDGSTDGTASVCRKLEKNDSRVRFLQFENEGVSAARNHGLDAACGEYVFFIDSDDVIYPRLIETLYTGMKSSGAAMGGSCIATVSDKDWDKVRAQLQKEPVEASVTVHTFEETLGELFVGKSPLNVLGGVLMRRDFIGETRFRTDLSIGEDFFFNYENLIKGTPCVSIDRRWYYARMHTSNASKNKEYAAFYSRFYRRVLVWRSEEAKGRQKYADMQKQDAFGCFSRCFRYVKSYSEDGRKMRRELRIYKKEIFPALTRKARLAYTLYAYLPQTARLLFCLKKT